MNLYINTSDTYCELALFKANKQLEYHIHNAPMAHSKVLHTEINQLLSRQGLNLQDLTSIAVLNGPGSYTGLRVGLAAAKGFCYSLDIPLILFNKLQLLCNNYLALHAEVKHVACIEPARQDERFFTLQERIKQIEAPNAQHIDTIQEILQANPHTIVISTKPELETQLNTEIKEMALTKEFLAETIQYYLSNKEFADIYRAEPFYLKKVHINKAKKRF